MEHDNESFSYTYSANQQEEIKRIRQKYIPPEENKMEQLRKLDESTTHLGKIVSLSVASISVIMFGIGMCCTTVWTDYFVLGIVIGIIGMIGIGAAFPLYSFIVKKRRKKLAPQIIKLTKELLGEE